MKVKAKICGITRYEDARLAAELGAWALGFIFYPKSPRYVSCDTAAVIIDKLKSENLLPAKTVGVFVNATADELQRVRERTGITTLQLHGDEPAALCAEVGGDIIKAFRLQKEDELPQLRDYAGKVSYYLLDAAVKDAYGGTGQLSDWTIAKAMKGLGPLLLSGGLNPENGVRAYEDVKPFALDLASGVEESPGKKSAAKLRAFFASIKDIK